MIKKKLFNFIDKKINKRYIYISSHWLIEQLAYMNPFSNDFIIVYKIIELF